jgi:hypothetical protein
MSIVESNDLHMLRPLKSHYLLVSTACNLGQDFLVNTAPGWSGSWILQRVVVGQNSSGLGFRFAHQAMVNCDCGFALWVFS